MDGLLQGLGSSSDPRGSGLGSLPNHVSVVRGDLLLQLHHRGEDPLYLWGSERKSETTPMLRPSNPVGKTEACLSFNSFHTGRRLGMGSGQSGDIVGVEVEMV